MFPAITPPPSMVPRPNSAYPPVYLPPPPGEQFTDSFVKGFGYSLGVATTPGAVQQYRLG